MIENTIESKTIDSVSKASKVSVDERKEKLTRYAQFAFLLIFCLVLLLMMFIPQKSKADETLEENDVNKNKLTLSENLQVIERLKEEEKQRKVVSQIDSKIEEAKHEKVVNKEHHESLSKEMLLRMNAPTTFENETNAVIETSSKSPNGINLKLDNSNKVLIGNDPNSQFVNGQADITLVTAKKIPHPSLTVPAGEMIPATLETAINSDLPGMVRSITTRDVYSLVGGNLLIPKGSTLVGQFSSNVMEGQNRILVMWTRVQMSNGVIVNLNSPGTDMLGRSGQGADYVDSHFIERFGTSALLSILGAYTATAGVNPQDEYNSASQYRIALANSFAQSSGQTLEKSMNIRPTLQINQGTKINVFVAHDLDFANVGKNPKENLPRLRSVAWK